MKFESESLSILVKALKRMDGGFKDLPDIGAPYDYELMKKVLLEVADKMRDNYPYFHPYYAGQMLKPPHPIARLAYMLSLWINPNNHALDGGKASSQMEKEAIAELGKLFGWENVLGHICSGGTMANLEALWIAGRTSPGKTVVASEQSHYTHKRISDVLKLEFRSVPCNRLAQMDINALEEALKKGNVGTVVATIGTTGTGAVDPLPEILELRKGYEFRIHADAAYGGYFILIKNLAAPAKKVYDCLSQVDSLVIDPHKHGLQPYGCGCVLFKDPGAGTFYKHDSPYTYFTSSELHLGEISLECSRPGASAVALWATQKLLPMKKDGEFATSLAKCREAALNLYTKLSNDPRFLTIIEPELDIVVWAPKAAKVSEISKLSKELFDVSARHNLHLATFGYPAKLLQDTWKGVKFDDEQATCLRSCLMKPEHDEWLEQIWHILDAAMNEVTGG
jgi:tyrosine decarboxylase / aspartate 1-decarboxylase